MLAMVAALGWAWREFGHDWWRGLRRASGRGRDDPVRREAGRWLHKLTVNGTVKPEASETLLALQRLRFGARVSWPEQPQRIFRRARRALREARRQAGATRS
jgi:hypothetical protein